MRNIGCFKTGPPFFHPVHRPVSVLPQDRDVLATAFLLYTRKNNQLFHFLRAGDIASVLESNFLLETETKIIIPGWFDNLKVSTWMLDMKDALLNYRDCNVIIVDWSKANGIPFAQAVANTRVVGAEVALLVNFLQDTFGVSPESCHIIGHSLGTEIAGYAGERINRLGRITALDPAGPYFRNVSTIVRLDPSDALFVDAIHGHSSDIDTDKPSRLEQTGHIDFYPNGGERQPGCPTPFVNTFIKKGVLDAARNMVVCDHYKVIDYFLATIPNHYGCKPVGVACDSWENFVAGKCSDCAVDGSQCAIMGFQADQKKELIKQHPPRKYYLYTGVNPPFCVQLYHVSVKLRDTGWVTDTVGDMEVILKGRYGSKSVNVSKRNVAISSGMVYRTVVHTPEDIDVTSIAFRWRCATFKVTDSIHISMDTEPEQCRLCLHSVIVTTYTTSLTNPGKQVVICGPTYPLPENSYINLKPDLSCTSDLY
ncbi:pancreatic lipase-related protein 2 [Trichonephila inaurata madagascariensis]|uniref:Pancreatic lipase-related protein 2 n=1 Tax=Trichonephila inaurata madagascariensis TaxID=2747483 RepID=A0A8X7BYU2_9ARAC|nr:pancreatic lipase-related protein 2 [Trichonephila inaurata madagascariensis]